MHHLLVKKQGGLTVERKFSEFHQTVHVCVPRRGFGGPSSPGTSIFVTVNRDKDFLRRRDTENPKWGKATVNWCACGNTDRKTAFLMTRALNLAIFIAQAMDNGEFDKEKLNG